MRRKDSVDIWLLHDRLSDYLREIHETRILATTSPEIAEEWGIDEEEAAELIDDL